jgi:enoyl-CoA hydratase
MLNEPELVSLERPPRGDVVVAEIWLNRPDKGNALTMAMIERLGEIADELGSDRDVRVVVLRGRGRFFCTGGDIGAWGSLPPVEMGRDWIRRGSDVFTKIATLPQPVIAAINGHALGGGLELAMAADLRVAVDGTLLGCPEATIGMIAGWMGTGRLAELIGPARARHLLLLGAPVPASQALDWGLVTALAGDTADLDALVAAWVERLAANGPAAMALIKQLVEGLHRDLRDEHATAVIRAAATEDCREGVRAFREKRPPVFRNR